MPDSFPLFGWPPVLDERHAATYLSLSATTFRRQVAPEIPSIQLTPGRVAWMRSDLDKWLAQRAAGGAGSPLPDPWADV